MSQIDAMDQELRSTVEAYAEGVTRGSRDGCSRRAHEFVFLRSRPTVYTAADVRGVLNLMSFAMATNWDSELTRLRVLEGDGKDALLALDPRYPEWLPVASPPGVPAGPVSDRLSEDLAAFGHSMRPGLPDSFSFTVPLRADCQ